MRLLILSDLHLEFWGNRTPAIDLAASNPDVVLLAGDIDSSALQAVAWAQATFAGLPVLYVHGNHEGYGRKLDHVVAKIAAACDATDNVHYLNRTEFVHQGCRFLGATLWTDFALFGEEKREECMAHAQEVMSDYRRSERLEQPFPGPSVVMTHMAPSFNSVSPQYAEDLSSAAYASNLDELVAKASVWVHGHMHTSSDYRIGRCRVVCNPCGYVNRAGVIENSQFRSDYIVDVPADHQAAE